MKKILCILFCLSFIFSLSACADTGLSDDSSLDSNSTISDQKPTDTPALPNEYSAILNNIINAYPWNDDDLTMVPENPELSYMYRHNSALSEVGFALMDLDNNGQAEMILADLTHSFIYDLYTISDGKAVHLFASGERYCFYLYENGFVENQWSGSAAESGHDFYKLNDGELVLIERITLDAYHALDAGVISDHSQVTGDNCFFRSDSKNEEDYQWIISEEAIKAIDNYQNANAPLVITYTPLSEYQMSETTQAGDKYQ